MIFPCVRLCIKQSLFVSFGLWWNLELSFSFMPAAGTRTHGAERWQYTKLWDVWDGDLHSCSTCIDPPLPPPSACVAVGQIHDRNNRVAAWPFTLANDSYSMSMKRSWQKTGQSSVSCEDTLFNRKTSKMFDKGFVWLVCLTSAVQPISQWVIRRLWCQIKAPTPLAVGFKPSMFQHPWITWVSCLPPLHMSTAINTFAFRHR